MITIACTPKVNYIANYFFCIRKVQHNIKINTWNNGILNVCEKAILGCNIYFLITFIERLLKYNFDKKYHMLSRIS